MRREKGIKAGFVGKLRKEEGDFVKQKSRGTVLAHNGTEHQQVLTKNYAKLVKKFLPRPHYLRNCFRAFWVGGTICALAQIVQSFFLFYFDFTKETVGSPTSAVMIFSAVVMTACGVYDKIAQYAGAGSAVPITGFANSMTSAALEHKSEGLVLGVGGNMFRVAGPVIVYGAVSAFLLTLLRVFVLWLWEMMV